MGADILVREIFTIINTLAAQNMDTLSGDTLSRLGVKLASYKASLGEHTSTAKRAVWDAELRYKEAKIASYTRLRDEGNGSGDAKELRDKYAIEELRAWNEARENEARITTLSMDCHDLIDSIKGRVINLQTERGESRGF